jgi:hypothetical protein
MGGLQEQRYISRAGDCYLKPFFDTWMHGLDLDKSVLCAGFTDDPELSLILKPSTATFSDDAVHGFDQSPMYERVGTIDLLSTGHINPKEQESGQRTQLRMQKEILLPCVADESMLAKSGRTSNGREAVEQFKRSPVAVKPISRVGHW